MGAANAVATPAQARGGFQLAAARTSDCPGGWLRHKRGLALCRNLADRVHHVLMQANGKPRPATSPS